MNDKILNNACNLSNDADSYFYSYLKLKIITKNNKQITTLLLSFSQHNIEKSIEAKWLLDDTHMGQWLKIYYVILDVNDFYFLFKQKPVEVIANLFPQILYPIKLLKGRKIYGVFSDMDHNVLKEEIVKYKTKPNVQDEKFIESTLEKAYLEKIKYLCNANGI